MSLNATVSEVPRVSVCMPVYNAEAVLQTTLDTVWKQSFSDFEVVAVDDGSTDGTSAILHGDRRIRTTRNPRNLGASATANRAIRHAQGEFVNYLDSDDLLEPQTLERLVQHLDQHPGMAFAFCRRRVMLDD